MRTIHNILHERILKQAGLSEPKKPRFKLSDLKLLEESEWSSNFETLMRNRLIMGALRYSTFQEIRTKPKGGHWRFKETLTKMIESYEQTGNSEFLVDAANYCLLAFEFDPHPTKHFYAQDHL